MPYLPLLGGRRAREDEEAKPAGANTNDSTSVSPTQQGATLLPWPISTAVSTGTGMASLSIRTGTKLGGWGIYAGRELTLKSLSVSRSAVEQILLYSGRDVMMRNQTELSYEEVDSILTKALSALYSSISFVSFFAASGFNTAESALNSSSGVSIHTLSMLNAIFGSTESSRAVAAIIALLRHELNKPEAGEVVSYRDLLFAMILFVFLQRWGRRQTQIDFRNAGGEEGIWDIVLDDRGFRADVVGTRRKEQVEPLSKLTAVPSLHPFTSADGDEEFEALERETLVDPEHVDLSATQSTNLSDDELRERIVRQLPEGARAVISTETFTAKTIKVDIYNADTAHIEAPPGTIMVAERLNHDDQIDSERPSQTVVFRTTLKRTVSAEISPSQRARLTSTETERDPADQDDVVMMKTSPLPVNGAAKRPVDDDDMTDLDRDVPDDDGVMMATHFSNKLANQKKSRKPANEQPSQWNPPSGTKMPSLKPERSKQTSSTRSEKGGKIKKALKTLSPSSSSAAVKDLPTLLPRKRSDNSKPLPQLPRLTPLTAPGSLVPKKIYPMPSLSNGHTPITSPVALDSPEERKQTSYFAIEDRRRNSSISQTETYSIHSNDSRPGSPTFLRTQTRTVNGLTKTKSEQGLSIGGSGLGTISPSISSRHHRAKSNVPSLYSMGSKHSGEAVVLQPRRVPQPRKSIYEDADMITLLQEEGRVPGIFPDRHLVKTVRRFCRFATASYGANFLQVMGLAEVNSKTTYSREVTVNTHHAEHHSFSAHTGLPPDTIVLSSFFDPAGSTGNTVWSPSAFSPLIHFISLDHDSKAVVLTCRGTLGFEDVLTDMTCDFDDLTYQGHKYKVHRGIHASARRLLGGSGSRVMAQLRDTLNDHKEYGLVLCGHSLGGAVAALVAIMISEPSPVKGAHSFVTGSPPKLLMGSTTTIDKTNVPPIQLPAGRPIHVYAYGSPATVSEPLRLATRGLITTIVNAADIVPSLSLGTLNDARTVAVHIKHSKDETLKKVQDRILSRLKSAVFSSNDPARPGPPAPENIAGPGVGQDGWSWSALKTLRATMINDKLVPPGEVFLLEATSVFDRLGADVRAEARLGNDELGEEKMYRALGRPATRVQFKLVRDVETRFNELKFGRDMFGDHSPGRYESRLGALEAGVCDQ